MKFELLRMRLVMALWALILLAAPGFVLGQNTRDAIEVLRGDLKADRKALIAEAMNLSPQESDVFWPIYGRYRAEAETVIDGVVKLILEYADLYPNVPEQKAAEMLKLYAKAETSLVNIKTKYLKKFGEVIPASKVFRFAQLDNRLDLGMRLGLAASVPLMPTGATQPTPTQR